MVADEAGELKSAAIDSYRHESQTFLKAKEYAKSQAALAAAFALGPTNRSVTDGLALHAQEALAGVLSDKSREAAWEFAVALRKTFPKVEGVAVQCQQHAYRVIQPLLNAGRFEDAEKVLADYVPFFDDGGEKIFVLTYDRWARSKMNDKDWAAAIVVYDKGLVKFPKNGHLQNNKRFCEQERDR